ncbi:response regulator [Alsobacter sp. SYSU BS001988]
MQKHLTILLVEDEPFVALSIAELLREQGHGVIRANDAAAGLALFAAHPEIGLLITDIGLPDLRGDALAEQCRSIRSIPVVFVSGYDTEEVQQSGQTTYVEKPFRSEEILAAVLEVRPLKPGQSMCGRLGAIRRLLRETLARELAAN